MEFALILQLSSSSSTVIFFNVMCQSSAKKASKLCPYRVDYLVNSVTPLLRITQHTVGPLKRKPQIRSTKLPGVTLKGTP